MRKIRKTLALALIISVFQFNSTNTSYAGCTDYPESVTPECVAQNLAAEQARQAAYAQAQAAEAEAAKQREDAARNAQAAADIARSSAEAALPADSCARSENAGLDRCVAERLAKAKEDADKAAGENAIRNAAAEAAQKEADAKLPIGDCARSDMRFDPKCVQAATEKAARERAVAQLAEAQTFKAADAKLPTGDCARSDMRFDPTCIKNATDKAAATAQAKQSLAEAVERLKLLAGTQYEKEAAAALASSKSAAVKLGLMDPKGDPENIDALTAQTTGNGKFTISINSTLGAQKVRITATKKGAKPITFTVTINKNGDASLATTKNLKGYTLELKSGSNLVDSFKVS